MRSVLAASGRDRQERREARSVASLYRAIADTGASYLQRSDAYSSLSHKPRAELQHHKI